MKKTCGALLVAALVCSGAGAGIAPATAAYALESSSDTGAQAIVLTAPNVPTGDPRGGVEATNGEEPELVTQPDAGDEQGHDEAPSPVADPDPSETEEAGAESGDPGSVGEVEAPSEIPEIAAPTALPTILGGGAAVGRAVTATTGEWPEADLVFSFQWQLDGVDIMGATQASFTPVPAQAGKLLSVVVTANRDGAAPRSVSTLSLTVSTGTLTAGIVTVSGATRVGQTLQAKPGSWAPHGLRFSYQWKRNGVAIAGATGEKYLLSAQDQGRRVTATITGALPGYASRSVTSVSTAVIGAGTLSAAVPTISGTATVGQRLSVRTTAWQPNGVKLTYQWKRDGATIARATGATYTLASADAGKRITVTVTGSLAGYVNTTKTSKATAQVSRVISAAPTPNITGTVRVGGAVTAQTGTWKPAGVKLRYQWLRNGAVITGATKAKYTPSRADAGKKLSVKVTGSKSGYQTVSQTSGAKTVPLVLSAAKPKVSGRALVGTQLTVSRGSWTAGTSFRYQWYRNGVALPGKTGSSYRVTSADLGSFFAVKVTGTKSGYSSESRTSATTAVVRYPSSTRPVSLWNCPTWAPIKGNASSMIYHMPWGAYYSRTIPEACFTTEAAARQAGYRASKR
ncbi:hypothetical protein EDF62_2657 [Leucobacter luti]|uniref:Ig-like domain-containing protein n=1 Tax=Leucobacter luti TaxID=340320 RepID=A0A4R6RVL2_9MICO|nr:hypothetical protein [Leucobacter luti]TDP91000.1 hypothetical protein EDF62_2657 [Leucobacter luti]